MTIKAAYACTRDTLEGLLSEKVNVLLQPTGKVMALVNVFSGIFCFKQTVKIVQSDRTVVKLFFGALE